MLDTPEVLPPITERIGQFGQSKFTLLYIMGVLMSVGVIIPIGLRLFTSTRDRPR